MDSYQERTLAELDGLLGRLTPADLECRAQPDKWSVAQILEHLMLAYTATSAGARRVLDNGAPTARRPSLRDRAAIALVVGLGYFPPHRQAPRMVVPRGLPGEEVLRDIRRGFTEMLDALAECERRFGPGKLADHPVLGPLSAAEWRKFHYVHTRHHLKQVRVLCGAASAAASRAGGHAAAD